MRWPPPPIIRLNEPDNGVLLFTEEFVDAVRSLDAAGTIFKRIRPPPG